MNNMDCQKVTLLVLLDLSAAFDTVSLDILSEVFQCRFNIKGSVLNWFQTYLTDRGQRILINNTLSDVYKLKVGVPQGSCAGPVAFLGYLSSLYDVIDRHLPEVGGYADDNQLYLAFTPGKDAENDAKVNMEKCIAEVRSWMLTHKLKINDSKTELMLIGSKQQLQKVNVNEIQVGASLVQSAKSARNLGVIFDENMSLVSHVNQICKRGYHQLTRIRQIRKCIDRNAAESLVHSFVTSTLDYCNSLLYGCPSFLINKLQILQNCAARIVTNTHKYEHITPVLKDLHWLPIPSRIEYKIGLLTYKCLNNQAPTYLEKLITPYRPGRTLRSSASNLLVIPKVKTNYGTRAFSYAAPRIWNNLPHNIKNAKNIDNFKSLMKTHLFKNAYK
jgi:hypothetical protein